MKKGIKIFLWILGILIVLLIILSIISIIALNEARPNSVSRAVICGESRDNCYYNCEQKLIGYFCKKDCDKSYNGCMGNI